MAIASSGDHIVNRLLMMNRLKADRSSPHRIQRERRVCQRGRGELQQPDRIVVAGDAVRAQFLAALAAMDQHPLVAPHPDRDRLHRTAAV